MVQTNPIQSLLVHDHGASTHPYLIGKLRSFAVTHRYTRGQEIYSPARPEEALYEIITGAAREVAILSSGRRRIIDLLLPRDFFGFGSAAVHGFTAEAITDGMIVVRYPLEIIEAAANADPLLGREVRLRAFQTMERMQRQILTLQCQTSAGKVGLLLLELAVRSDARHKGRFTLPLSRYDIADYLGLSSETVSRTFTAFRLRGLISLSVGRDIRILDYGGLAGYSGLGEEALQDAMERDETSSLH